MSSSIHPLKIGKGEFRRSLFGRNSWFLFFFAAFLIFTANIFINKREDFSVYTAHRIEKSINKRFAMLESYMMKALSSDKNNWIDVGELPEDMVIYRYRLDSLQSWANQFSIDNDDIRRKMVLPRIVSWRYDFSSPLSDVGPRASYMNIGPKWYVVKSISDSFGWKVIGGLEIRNTLDTRSVNGVNSIFRLSDRFSILSIDNSGGSVVCVDGIPLMKILQETTRISPIVPDSTMVWIAITFLLVGIMVIMFFNRTLKVMWLSILAITLTLSMFYYVGYGMQGTAALFSPAVYAGGAVFGSLGSLLIINLWISLIVLCIYSVRRRIAQYFLQDKHRKGESALIAFVLGGTVLLSVYIVYTFRSLILNSNVSLELYKIPTISIYTLYIYLSYFALLIDIPLLLQVIRNCVYHRLHVKYDVFTMQWQVPFSVISAVMLLIMVSVLGGDKENSRIEIWMNRLAIDRDISLELQLRGVERAIASDNTINDIIRSGDYRVLLNRITETYMSRISKDYDVSLHVYGDKLQDQQLLAYVNDRLVNSVPIATGSNFVYSHNANGRPQYTGLFVYYSPQTGSTKLVIGVNSKADKEERGYSVIFNSVSPDRVIIPQEYSYAKYIGKKLVTYSGDYPYPTEQSPKLRDLKTMDSTVKFLYGKYIHFINFLSDNECVLISRPTISVLQYAVSAALISLLLYFSMSLIGLRRKRNGDFEKNYYKSRVNTVLFLSMMLTLVAMSSIMVYFVYKRNDTNTVRLMTDKVSTMQSIVETYTRTASSYNVLATQDMTEMIDQVGNYTRSDLTFFTPGGKVFNTTDAEVYEKMMLGSRINPDAYRNIMYDNRRYYIHKERIGVHRFYIMYAPVLNDNGDIVAIVSAPYTDSSLSFMTDAIFHSVFVITVFFILLILTRLWTMKVVDKMFRPIVAIGRKMLAARTGGLEYIVYDKEDEISGLVRAYNLMVHDLYESGKQVAQIEREHAWSEMARQVAHEIKNPLTPIKLQIQRLIRLKHKNDPSWEDKFDEISRLVLDSIDVLTDTANEFSTFAKLYTQELSPVNLDELASDEVAMFDNKENISFQYLGLKDAWVMAPKPQLIRVFVNLLTNAVQAIENQQKEDEEKGITPVHGQINLSLRNSNKEGFYDIVVEDNGPGVKDENRAKLFAPNFTTKSSGTGLGLAICRSILERCGGDIQYSKSFVLGGASFTIRIPKHVPGVPRTC